MGCGVRKVFQEVHLFAKAKPAKAIQAMVSNLLLTGNKQYKKGNIDDLRERESTPTQQSNGTGNNTSTTQAGDQREPRP